MHRRSRLLALILALMMATAGSQFVVTPAIASEPDEPPPYHARGFDLVDLPFDRLPWTSDPPPALPALPPLDDKGIRLFRWNDGDLYYRPGSIAINGMKRIDAYRDTGDRAQLEQALVQAEHLRDMRIVEDDAWWLPFWFDYPPEGLTAPWFNAMSQGLVLSFFVRLHRVTGDDLHLRAAERVFESYRRLGRKKAGRQRPWWPMSPMAATSGWSTIPTLARTTFSTRTCTRSSGSTSTGSTLVHQRRGSCWRARSRRCAIERSRTGARGGSACTGSTAAPTTTSTTRCISGSCGCWGA